MTVTVTHNFASAIPDDPDAVIAGSVLPSHWNEAHQITGLGTAAEADATDFAAALHSHAINDVTGLQTALDAKLDDSQATAYGLSLLDDVDAAAARTTLGLGTLATQSGTFSGTSSGTNTGDQTITLSGDVGGSGTTSITATISTNAITTTKIQTAAVTLSKLATMADQTFIANNSGSSAVPQAVTAASVKTMLGLSGTNSGDQTITLTGDVTGSGTGSFAATIGAGKVTNSMLAGSIAASKLVGTDIATVGTITSGTWNGTDIALANIAQIATDRLLGRDTAGTGDIETISVGGGIQFSGAGSIYVGAFTGDVTKTAGDTVLTIATDAVTYAKMQNVSATDKILGRSTAGAGDVEEIPCTAAGRALLDDADATAQRTTLGLGSLATKSAIDTADINSGAVEFGKFQNVNANTLLGRSAVGSGAISEQACTAAGFALLDDADAAAQRTTLGLGTAAVEDTSAFENPLTFAGSLSRSGDTITNNVQYLTMSGDVASSSTAMADVTGMSFTGAAGAKYLVTGVIVFRSAATTTGLGLAWNTPAGDTGLLVFHHLSATQTMSGGSAITDDTTKNLSVGVTTLNENVAVGVQSVIHCVNGGTVQLRLRSEVNASAVTIESDYSILRVERVS